MSLLRRGFHYFAEMPLNMRGGSYAAADREMFTKTEKLLSRFANDQISDLASIPIGYCGSSAIHPPLTTGSLSTTSKGINGVCSISYSNLAGGRSVSSSISGESTVDAAIKGKGVLSTTLTGNGIISDALLNAVVSIYSTVYGEGVVLGASLQGVVPISATLTASGQLTNALLNSLINIYANLLGEGAISYSNLAAGKYIEAVFSGDCTVSGADLRAKAGIGAAILVNANLTTFDIAQAVWNALAVQYNISGTMGQKLNAAGSAGDPWVTELPSSYTGDQAGRILWNLNAYIKNKKYLTKEASTWYLIIRNDSDTGNLIKKELKDKDGNDITDIQAGVLAQELASNV